VSFDNNMSEVHRISDFRHSSQVISICNMQQMSLYWFDKPGLQLDNKVPQSTNQPHGTSATSTTVTGPVGERFQPGTEDTPVLDRPAPLRRFHNSGARYKYPDLLTYLQYNKK